MIHAKLVNNYFKIGNTLPNQTHIARIYNGLRECRRKKMDTFLYKLSAIELSRLLKIKGLIPATDGIDLEYMNVTRDRAGKEQIMPYETYVLEFKLKFNS